MCVSRFHYYRFRAKRFLYVLLSLGLFIPIIVVTAGPVCAVRPFVTDDARVVGEGILLLETSVRYDENRFQNQNFLAFGPEENLELSVGFVQGILMDKGHSRDPRIAGPLMQAKYLLDEGKPNGLPGLAFVVGGSPPMGSRDFRPDTWTAFAYAAVTESLFDRERLLIHGNIGTSVSHPGNATKAVVTWGIGSQLRIAGGLHVMGEVFSGDPYSGGTSGAFQAGFRYFATEKVQADLTVGSGLWGDDKPVTWVGMGLRIMSSKLW